VINWLGVWIVRCLDRKRWRHDLSRKMAYAELGLHAAKCALAAKNGGYFADAHELATLSERLRDIGRSGND
jgi:hypothetical protein